MATGQAAGEAAGQEGYRLEARLFGEQGMFGTLDESLDFADGYFLGKAVGTYLHHKHSVVYACVASDSHPLSLPLESEVVRGLLECGVRVLSFSVSPAPLVRFATIELRAQVAFSIARGSLPARYSGMKIFLEGSALDAERALQLRNIASNGSWRKSAGGRLARSEGVEAYTMRLFAEDAWSPGSGGGGGGGGGGQVRLPRVLLSQSEHGGLQEVMESIAENLSAHAERVLVLEDAAALRAALREEREQIGFLFNSDGTALQTFVGGGREISAEELFGLLLPSMSLSSRRRVVLTDGFVSRQMSKRWQSLGVRVVRCPRFGAGLLTALSSQSDAFASVSGSISASVSCDGHIALCDRYYPFEDAFYVALRFLSLLATGSIGMAALRSSPEPHASGLRRVVLKRQEGGGSFFGNKEALLVQLRACVHSQISAERDLQQSEQAQEVTQEVAQEVTQEVAEEVERTFSYGRWIVRASRFEEVLFARCEGEDAGAVAKVEANLREALASCGTEAVLS